MLIAATLITLHYATLITLHYIALHYATLFCTTLHYTRLDYTTARSTTAHYTTLHYIALHSIHHSTTTTATAPHKLHYTTTRTAAALHHTTSSSCGWGDHCNHCNHSKQTQLQPPFGPSVDSLCHPCITTTHLPYSVLSLKLPPPPCEVLLLYILRRDVIKFKIELFYFLLLGFSLEY